MRNAVAEIFYFEWRVFRSIIFQNLIHFQWKRFFLTLAFIVVILFISLLTVLLRLADEIFYRNYRKTEVRQPVFIISNPRSGTTYLHRLLCLDEERFTYFLLYHTFLPSVTFYRFILLLKKVDKRLNWPLKRFFTRVEERVFAGWKDIHPMGFEESEEDEGLFVLSLMSPAIGLICPWFKEMKWLWIPDRLSPAKKEAMMAYYRNTIQRFMYAWGQDKIFLSKNVISTGRMEMLLSAFPDAKIIYPVRHPYQTIPSVTSMFSAPWKVLADDLSEKSQEYRAWGAMSQEFYMHLYKMMERLDPDQLFYVDYEEFINNPKKIVLELYQKFGWSVNVQFLERLEQQTSHNKKYRSNHNYSLEQYGYRKEEVYYNLQPVFKKFGFEP